MTTHTVDEALSTFELVRGAGSEASREACAMTLLAWMAGKPWTDHPECAHPILASTVIGANDAPDTTAEMRAKLVRLGQDGVLDTWWIPATVVAWSLAGERDKPVSTYERATRALARITEWKTSKQRPDLTGADLRGADLTGAYLTGRGPHGRGPHGRAWRSPCRDA